jgi:GNAT superfamily N-acetyltransferase
MFEIRLSNWGDRARIIPVREHLRADLVGDLYEMLTWPTYHVHSAWHLPAGSKGPDRWDAGKIVAYGTLALCGDGVAEATEMVVLPDYRRRRLASRLRMTQLRDLNALGFPVLCQSARTPEGQAWCATHMDQLGPLPDGSMYYRGTTELMRDHLRARGVPPEREYFDEMLQHTQKKTKAAWAHLALLGRVAETQRAKVMLRSA